VLAVLWSQAGARQTVILAGLLMVVLAALVLPPFLFLLKASVVDAQRGGGWSLANFEAVLGSRHFLESSANSILFAAASTAVALAIGWISAWIVERTNSPLKPLAYLTAVVSLGTPYILYVTAWLLLLGKAGPVNQLYRALTGTSDVLINVYSIPA
jgi:iron(III) transport system permease protein